jgi:hypothetical protein
MWSSAAWTNLITNHLFNRWGEDDGRSEEGLVELVQRQTMACSVTISPGQPIVYYARQGLDLIFLSHFPPPVILNTRRDTLRLPGWKDIKGLQMEGHIHVTTTQASSRI